MPTTIWTGAVNGALDNAGNWNNGVPNSTTDAVISGAATLSSGYIEALTLNMSGFTGTIAAACSIDSYGNITLSSSVTAGAFGLQGPATLTPNGATVTYITLYNGAITLAGNLTIQDGALQREVGMTGTFAIGSNIITMNAVNAPPPFHQLAMGPSDTWTWTSGKIVISIAASRNFKLRANGTAPTGSAYPPIEVSGAGTLEFETDWNSIITLCTLSTLSVNGSSITRSFDMSGTPTVVTTGAVTLQNANLNLDGRTMTIGGGLSATNTSVSSTTLSITGTATAAGGTWTNVNASGGTAITVTGGTNGGGNSNVNFVPVTVTTWTGAAADGDIMNAANWNYGLPDATIDAVIGGSNTGLAAKTAPYVMTCKGLDCSGFTGSIGDTVGDNYFDFSPNGTVTFSAGMTVNSGHVGIYDGGSFSIFSAGHSFYYLTVTAATTMTLLDNLTVSSSVENITFNNMGTVALGTRTLTFRSLTGTPSTGSTFTNGGTWTWSGSAKIVIDYQWSPGVGTNDLHLLNGDVASVLPPVEMSATVAVQAQASNFYCTSLVATGPITFRLIPAPGSATSIRTVGNLTVTDCAVATFPGYAPYTTNPAKVVVGGNFVSNNGDLGLAGEVAILWLVTGTAVANDATIAACNFSGGTALDATNNCVDGLNNVNVNFGAPPAPNVVARSKTRGLLDGKPRIASADRGETEAGKHRKTAVE